MAKKVRAKQLDLSGFEVRQIVNVSASTTPSVDISSIIGTDDNNQSLFILVSNCDLTLNFDQAGPYQAKTIRCFTYNAIASITLTKPGGALYNVLLPGASAIPAGSTFFISWYASIPGQWIVYTAAEAGTGPEGPEGPDGPTGATGPTGAAGSDGKTVRNGSGVPSGGLGVDGDFYIDTSGKLIYGPKSGGSWGSGVQFGLPAGSDGKALIYQSGSWVAGNILKDASGNEIFNWFNGLMKKSDGRIAFDLGNEGVSRVMWSSYGGAVNSSSASEISLSANSSSEPTIKANSLYKHAVVKLALKGYYVTNSNPVNVPDLTIRIKLAGTTVATMVLSGLPYQGAGGLFGYFEMEINLTCYNLASLTSSLGGQAIIKCWSPAQSSPFYVVSSQITESASFTDPISLSVTGQYASTASNNQVEITSCVLELLNANNL